MGLGEPIKLITYRYDGIDRPDLGLKNGELYVSEDIRERGWFRAKEIKINGRWFTWAGFTEVLTDKSEIKSISRDNKISSLLGEL